MKKILKKFCIIIKRKIDIRNFKHKMIIKSFETNKIELDKNKFSFTLW